MPLGSSKRVITKASIAKKILKKNIKANQKILFDEDGDTKAIEGGTLKKSKEGQEYDQDLDLGGIDMEKARKMLKAEDKFDRQVQKEQRKAKKRELKEAQKANSKRNQHNVSILAKEISLLLCVNAPHVPKFFPN